MPSREVGNLAVALAFALFAFFCSTRTVWCENFFELLPIGGGRPAAAASDILAHFTGAEGEMENNKGGGGGGGGDESRAAAEAPGAVDREKAGGEEEKKKKDKKKKKKAAAAASEPTVQEKQKEAEQPKAPKKEKAKTKKVKTPLSPEVIDPDTGLVLPRVKKFSLDEDLVCLGVGARVKKIAFLHVNVYTVGLYVEPKRAREVLKDYAGADPADLPNDPELFNLLQTGGLDKFLHLVFARSVSAQKVVDAVVDAVTGVSPDVLDRFSSMMLEAIGSSIDTNESVSLGWVGKNKMVGLVRDKLIGTIEDDTLPPAVFDIYLGADPISPVAKAAFAEGVPPFLAS